MADIDLGDHRFRQYVNPDGTRKTPEDVALIVQRREQKLHALREEYEDAQVSYGTNPTSAQRDELAHMLEGIESTKAVVLAGRELLLEYPAVVPRPASAPTPRPRPVISEDEPVVVPRPSTPVRDDERISGEEPPTAAEEVVPPTTEIPSVSAKSKKVHLPRFLRKKSDPDGRPSWIRIGAAVGVALFGVNVAEVAVRSALADDDTAAQSSDPAVAQGVTPRVTIEQNGGDCELTEEQAVDFATQAYAADPETAAREASEKILQKSANCPPDLVTRASAAATQKIEDSFTQDGVSIDTGDGSEVEATPTTLDPNRPADVVGYCINGEVDYAENSDLATTIFIPPEVQTGADCDVNAGQSVKIPVGDKVIQIDGR